MSVGRVGGISVTYKIEGMLLPAISNLHTNKKDSEIRTLVHDAERYVAMVCIPLVLMTIVWSSEIILVFIKYFFN